MLELQNAQFRKVRRHSTPHLSQNRRGWKAYEQQFTQDRSSLSRSILQKSQDYHGETAFHNCEFYCTICSLNSAVLSTQLILKSVHTLWNYELCCTVCSLTVNELHKLQFCSTLSAIPNCGSYSFGVESTYTLY